MPKRAFRPMVETLEDRIPLSAARPAVLGDPARGIDVIDRVRRPRPPRDGVVAVTPAELDTPIANPGMGWQSFYTNKSDDPNNEGISSRSAYQRFYWGEFERTPGDYSFDWFSSVLEDAAAAGQGLMFRLMPYGHDGGSPAWLREMGAAGTWFSYDGGPLKWAADPEDPIVRARHDLLLAELGRRFDGHPGIDAIDIGSIGLWGEWHEWGTVPALPHPSPETARAYIDRYFEAFPTTPKIALTADRAAFAYAVARGAGWRGDGLGDPSEHAWYDESLAAAGANGTWRTAPVAFEMWGDLRSWPGEAARIVDYVLTHHASYVNNKSQPIPDEARPEVDRLLSRLGYRFVLRRLQHTSAAVPGRSLALLMDWENVGVAPSYRGDVLAIQVRSVTGAVIRTTSTGITVRGWQPGGVHRLMPTVPIPAGLPRGTYAVAVGIVDPATMRPTVALAIEGRDAAGWYPLSTFRVGEDRPRPRPEPQPSEDLGVIDSPAPNRRRTGRVRPPVGS